MICDIRLYKFRNDLTKLALITLQLHDTVTHLYLSHGVH